MKMFLTRVLSFSFLLQFILLKSALPNHHHHHHPAYFITGICLLEPGDITTFLFSIFIVSNKVLLKYITT